ncbi:MAG: hypothetical protein DCC55_25125 [Chloroflexi bacterium]|nr:MAG: hypothetical protein DCC55_25125 [Chloroflexota bacterium]
MTWFEYTGNIHIHTTYSDGVGTFDDVVEAALWAGDDFVYVTDHNVLVREREEGYRRGLLTLVGQEVHDDDRVPQRNHLLCLGVTSDVTGQARDPQQLIDAVNAQQGLSFLAHPYEEVTPLAPDHWAWESWEVGGYTGVELWNYMSSFRGFTTSRFRTLVMGIMPHWFLRAPLSKMVRKWDELTQQRQVVAIGGTDVHGWTIGMGPLRRVFLPYRHCAQALNTHILTPRRLLGAPPNGRSDPEHLRHDRELVLDALRRGHCWVGYDLAGATRGFRFAAWQTPAGVTPPAAESPHAIMGDGMALPQWGCEIYLRVDAPAVAEIRLLRNGHVVTRRWGRRLEYFVSTPGVYRAELWRTRWGRLRGWIFSNPIYVRDA